MASYKRDSALSFILCLLCARGAQADTATATAPAGGGSSGTSVLEEVVVSGVSLEDQVSPLQRKVS
jgi:hypothetical protein